MLSQVVLKPVSYFSRDEEISARIERTIRSRAGGRIQDLRVEVNGGDVVVSGRTNTYYAKQLATHAAMDEISQRSLTNSIEVI